MAENTERRTRTVGTKLSEEEYARLEALAASRGLSPGEWVRDLILTAFNKPESQRATGSNGEQAVLSEVLALRAVVLNVVYDLAAGHEIDEARMAAIIEQADAGKLTKALERLKQ